MRSDADDHAMRPIMFDKDKSPTNPAATAGRVPNRSVIIGDAFSRMPIPADTLKQSTIHRHQNCGVRIAFFAETLALVTSVRATVGAVHPAGFQSSRGTRTSAM